MSIFIDQESEQYDDNNEDISQYKYYNPIIKFLFIYMNIFINKTIYVTTQIIKNIDTYMCTFSEKDKESIKVVLYYYIKSYITCDKIYKLFTRFIPEHAIEIITFNTKTNKIHKMIPLLGLFKYYRIPRRSHEVYYSITVWSNKERKYVSLFIDGIILNELENIYKIDPYSVTHILGLLKYTNNIKYINIKNTQNEISYYVDNYIQKSEYRLNKYYNSLSIPNNITVHALNLLYLYIHKCPVIDLLDYKNTLGTIITLVHNNDYETIFREKNGVVFTSLDVDLVD